MTISQLTLHVKDSVTFKLQFFVLSVIDINVSWLIQLLTYYSFKAVVLFCQVFIVIKVLCRCLYCISFLKYSDEDTVDQDINEEEENSDRSSLSSSHNAPRTHSIASTNTPSADAAASPAPGAESLGNETEATENYIALDKCFSGARPTKVQTMPRLVQRDFHLLDLVPPSPCSLRENLGSLSGMPEVYAPMSPHKTSSRTARGSLGGIGARAVDGSNKIQQMTPQSHRKELFTFEMKIPENQTLSNQSLKADLQNSRTVFNAQADHGHRMCSRGIEFQNRIPYTSISSDASSVETRACHNKPSETLHSLHSSSSTDHNDQPHYCNISVNPLDGMDGGQSLLIDDAVEFSESNGKWHPSDPKSQSCSWQTEEAFKILHMSPQAPVAQKNKPKLQKYVNAHSGTDFDHGASVSGFETYPSVRNCPEESAISGCDGYYNILPNNSHSSRAEYGELITNLHQYFLNLFHTIINIEVDFVCKF